MQTIMLIGLDQSLLRTRAAVLARTGCRTVCASVANALPIQEQCRADLVVICHTVPEGLSIALVNALHDRWQGTRVLLVLEPDESMMRTSMSLADGVSSTAPERLLRHSAELLRSPGRHAMRAAEPAALAYMH